MNLAALMLEGSQLHIDPLRDVNQTAAIVWDAKTTGGTSSVLILGGGSPKNFMLQTEPQIQEVLGLAEAGHDYFLQFTDARPDTGGLSGATPSEAMTWGKVDPEQAARFRDLLRRLHDCTPASDRLQPDADREAHSQAPVR